MTAQSEPSAAETTGRVPASMAVTGSSGLVGRRLCARLSRRGCRTLRLVRRAGSLRSDEVFWDPAGGSLDAARLEGVDCVVHLAGHNIAAGRWTAARKHLIRSSRLEGTRLLSATLAGLERPPGVLVSASAVGYYGDRGDEPLTEASPPGEGFLAELCREWEAATGPAAEAGIRVVRLRIGLVLSAQGGALARMLRPFRLGLGGVMGSGRQYMSWIALDDLVAAIEHLIRAADVSGPVNAVAPRPVSNREFTRTLGRVLRRPTLLRLPAPAVRLLFGELGRELLLAGARVLPVKLEASGFAFAYPGLEQALRRALLPADAAGAND